MKNIILNLLNSPVVGQIVNRTSPVIDYNFKKTFKIVFQLHLPIQECIVKQLTNGKHQAI